MSSRDPDDRVPLDPADDVMRAIALMEWARKKGFRIGPVVQVGDVRMQISDVRQVKFEGLDQPDGRPVDMGPYAEHGLTDEDPAPGTAG